MKLKNTSNKIVNIGKTILMPGDEMQAHISMSHLPAIRAMVKRGTLAIDDTEERIAAAAEERIRIEAEATSRAQAEAARQAAEAAKTAEAEKAAEAAKPAAPAKAAEPVKVAEPAKETAKEPAAAPVQAEDKKATRGRPKKAETEGK